MNDSDADPDPAPEPEWVAEQRTVLAKVKFLLFAPEGVRLKLSGWGRGGGSARRHDQADPRGQRRAVDRCRIRTQPGTRRGLRRPGGPTAAQRR